jgi:butyryl-CoA dehydrogenase
MQLTDEQSMIQDAARKFAVERLAPHAGDWDRSATFPQDALTEMGRLGFLGMLVPEDWGGVGAGHLAYGAALEEIAAGCGAVSTIMSGHNSVGCLPILQFGDAAQKESFLPSLASGENLSAFCLTEPHAGSDASTLRTRAEKKGDHYILNGVKQFVTTGSNADIALVFARTGAPDSGKAGISAFIVPTRSKGYAVARVEDKMGQRASDTCQIVLEDVEVPAENRLGDEGAGYRIALANLESGRIGIASQAVGMARAAFEAALAYAKERETFGKPIIEHQAVGFRLAEMATEIEAARQMVRHAAALRDAGQPCLKEASMAKTIASDMAETVCSDALQTLGGYGYLEDHPLERILRDVRVCRIYEGSNDIQRLVISRALARDMA